MSTISEDPRPDSGLAQVSYEMSTAGPTTSTVYSKLFPGQKAPELVDTLHGIVYTKALSPEQKLMMLYLALEGFPKTADEIAEQLGMTRRSVQYGMRKLVEWGAVATDLTPNDTLKQYVRTYELVKVPADAE